MSNFKIHGKGKHFNLYYVAIVPIIAHDAIISLHNMVTNLVTLYVMHKLQTLRIFKTAHLLMRKLQAGNGLLRLFYLYKMLT